MCCMRATIAGMHSCIFNSSHSSATPPAPLLSSVSIGSEKSPSIKKVSLREHVINDDTRWRTVRVTVGERGFPERSTGVRIEHAQVFAEAALVNRRHVPDIETLHSNTQTV